MLRRFLVTVSLVCLLSACYPPVQAPAVPSSATPSASGSTGTPAAPANLKSLTIAMGYIPSVQFAPFYVAQERGYFRAEGLDVTFQYGFESDLMKLVGTNQLQFMIGSGEEVILGRSQGLPVRYVMRWYRSFPVVLFAKESEGIKTAQDLVGKTVGIPMLSGASYVGWQAIVKSSGLDASKVNLQTIGFTQASAISQDRVDAALDYSVNGPVQLRLAGEKVTVLPVAGFIDLPSNGIITNEQTIRDAPGTVQALVNAVTHGLSDTLDDPDTAFAASLRAVPEAGGAQAATNRAIFDESLKLWQADRATLGHSDPIVWERAAKFMREINMIQVDVPPADLYTNQFVKP